MSGRGEKRGGMAAYYAIRGALVVVVIAAALGVFGKGGAFRRAELGAANLLGLAVMAAGLVVTVVASAKRKDDPSRGRAAAFMLAGTMVCGVGAIMAICL